MCSYLYNVPIGGYDVTAEKKLLSWSSSIGLEESRSVSQVVNLATVERRDRAVPLGRF